MVNRRLTNPIRPYISAIAVIGIAAALVFTIFFTILSVEWVAFLAGVLVAAVLAEATRVSRTEWLLARRTAQASDLKNKSERDATALKAAEAKIAASKPRLHLLDEVIPTMVAFVDVEGHCRYHNRAFREWLHLRPNQIDGRHIREVIGYQVYQEIASFVRQAMDGHTVSYERTQKMADGSIYRLAVEHLPQFADGGKIEGFFLLANDITKPADVAAHAHAPAAAPAGGTEDQDLFLDSFSDHIKDQKDAAKQIATAIEKNDFRLFCQQIVPLGAKSGPAEYSEVLIRMAEEEEGMMPPGAFFPLAEKLGVMAHLDRWVVQHVAELIATRIRKKTWREGSILFINLSDAAIEDPGFADYAGVIQLEYGIPGAALCFEIPSNELARQSAKVASFAQSLNQRGFHVALSGFGRDKVMFDLIRGFRISFLKIDASIVLNILHDPVALAKAVAIHNVAKKIGVKSIAEYVESEEMIVKLREIGVDLAQGFGIERPKPLEP